MSFTKNTNTSDYLFSPDGIVKQYKRMTNDELALAITLPELSNSVLAIVSRLTDSQLQAVIPVASLDHIRKIVPKLQLQQNGAAFQAMSPEQVRVGISALPPDDRELLMQNIALFTSSSSKDDIQSFISFVDPLALCIAVGLKDLAPKIISYAGVMALEQIKVIVPMMTCEQLRDLLTVLEDENQITTAISMIDNKSSLANLLIQELPPMLHKLQDIKQQLQTIASKLPPLEKKISTKADYNATVKAVKSAKSEIEALQQLCRDLQASVKVPCRILSPVDHRDAYQSVQKITADLAQISKDLYAKFEKVGTLIQGLTNGATPSAMEDEDADGAVELYEAVKQIGNPDAVGNHYRMTWNEIIQAGFRTVQDFVAHGITNLEQLQQYIDKSHNK